jgi:ribosome-associated heat shock protein Hsp15
MINQDGVRVDKWLWATRLFKTRAQAAQACLGDRVKIGLYNVKPARLVRPGEIIIVRRPDLLRTVQVKAIVDKRIGPKQVGDFLEDLTPPAEYQRQKEFLRASPARRERGSGRPTKKDRRDTDQFFGL